ncbi:MAG: hypothetical protein EOO65_01195, partial [Methanosarcinales archaeon]
VTMIPTILTLQVPTEEAILDGEVLAWDATHEHFVPFGSNRTVAWEMSDGDGGTRNLCFIAFDILWLRRSSRDDAATADMTHMPLAVRKQVLADVLVPQQPFVTMLAYTRHNFCALATSGRSLARREAVLQAFTQALNNGEEGVMLKQCSSKYQPGSRGNAWMKVRIPPVCKLLQGRAAVPRVREHRRFLFLCVGALCS